MSRSRRSVRDEDGVALVEFSLVIVIFVFILYALIAFGMMLAVKQSLTQAAADGARAAIGATDLDGDGAITADDQVARAHQRVKEALKWLGDRYEESDTTAVVASCPEAPDKDCITVTITYPYESRPLVPPAPGLGLVTPERFHTESVVELD